MSQFYTSMTLNRDIFMLHLIAALGSINESILGSQATDEYIMTVGLHMGAAIEAEYKQCSNIDRPLTVDEYVDIIIDFKQRIQGNFSLVEKSDDRVVVNTRGSFLGQFMRQSSALCIMTSNLFGGIAARNFGWAKLVHDKHSVLHDDGHGDKEAIPNYTITIFLKKTPEALEANGEEYRASAMQVNSQIAEQLQLVEKVRKLHSKLNESEARWQEAMERIEDAVVAIDEQTRCVFVNRKWCEITGYSAQEGLGLNIIDKLVVPEERSMAYEAVAKMLQGEVLPPFFRHIINRRGKIVFLRTVSAPIRDDQGHVIGVMSVFHDITLEKELEIFKDELLSITAHEMRTPITAIQGIIQSILRTLRQDVSLAPAALKKRLEVMEHATDKLVLLSNNLSDVSRLQNVGYVQLPRKHHDMNDIVTVVIERLKSLEGSTSFTWDITLSSTPLPIFANGSRIERALHNILENALKYSFPCETITVETKHDGKYAIVVVTDQGIGIPEEEIEKITNAFYRASNTPLSNYSGIGLGLFLAKTIIDAHNGILTFKSQNMRGTTVTIQIPLIG